jgi:ubiquinone/menaquinone biosynthesis C-methylase UbiE
MAESKMYRELAKFYDLIYADKDYRGEAALLRSNIRTYARSGGRDLLDVGCGTGRHLEHLQKWFHCTGVEQSPAMLRVARARLPDAHLVKGSMEDFRLRSRFDAITCMFGVIGYTRTVPRMTRAIASMAEHLKPGGVLLVQPWVTPDRWTSGRVFGKVGQGPGISVVRVTRSARPRPRISRLEAQYLIARKEGISHVVEAQDLGLFQREEVARAFRLAGLRYHHIPVWHEDPKAWNRRGMHLGVKALVAGSRARRNSKPREGFEPSACSLPRSRSTS